MEPHEVILIAATSFGALTDVRTGKIPNALTYPLCFFGIVYAIALGGQAAFLDSLSGFFLAFIPGFLLYLSGGLGGGDVKMMAAVGSLMGFHFTASAMLTSIFVGALIALLIVIWEGKILATLGFLGHRLCGRSRRHQLEVDAQVPFGVAIFLACVVTWAESRAHELPFDAVLQGWMG